ncbi:hypothetical protein PLANPX_4029 [Lacipirellula parvula]|uniref:Uncharacterized protein n=1 Tax=Lacipirellula parvula TaxID=2650471 RepID=A0A5K7XEC7_9BACT|nr:hypothetical protein PLANPX_4029 [Lacipirellula parvula]
MRKRKRKYVGVECHRCGQRIARHEQIERSVVVLRFASTRGNGEAQQLIICPACDRFIDQYHRTFWLAFGGVGVALLLFALAYSAFRWLTV